MNKVIFILSESQAGVQMLKDVLEASNFGYQCRTIQSMDELAQLLKTEVVDILLVDRDYPDEGLYRKIKKIRFSYPSLRVIMLADQVTPHDLIKAQEHFIEGFCQKNEDYLTLINTIEQVIM